MLVDSVTRAQELANAQRATDVDLRAKQGLGISTSASAKKDDERRQTRQRQVSQEFYSRTIDLNDRFAAYQVLSLLASVPASDAPAGLTPHEQLNKLQGAFGPATAAPPSASANASAAKMPEGDWAMDTFVARQA